MFVTVIGRGHSGTRAISQTLTSSGVFMGDRLNESGDLVPPGGMYRAARILSRHVKWRGGTEWDFSSLDTMPIPPAFEEAVRGYLAGTLASAAEHRGWKLPETTLCYPWIRRMFPDIRYVFWVRNPRDCILGRHMTDDLGRWGIGCPPTEDERLRRAYSWIYQYRLVKAVPRPRHWIEIRFEDFVLDQDHVLGRIGDFLGIPLSRIPVNPDAVGRYRTDHGRNHHDFFEPAMREYGYAIPDPNDPARAPAAPPMAPPPRHVSTARECPSADAAEALPLRVFEDVPIMPYTDLPHGRTRAAILHRGGPVWPDWDRQVEARHRRKGEPVDVPPDIAPPAEVWDEPVAWAGAIVDHFGHQIADFSCRLLPTLAVNPATVFAFAVRPGDGIDSLESAPRFFGEILAWLGVPPERVRVVTRPTLARHLAVAPQAEQLGGPGEGRTVSPRYLDALDELTLRRLGTRPQEGTVYVSRAGLGRRFAGERELEMALSRAGIDVFRPEEHALVEQLRRYAGARRLVFSEGSALHGLQLLGRVLGDVVVVSRRPQHAIGKQFVPQRARSLTHLDFGVRLVHGLTPDGTVGGAGALPVVDEGRLIDGFEAIGIPVGRQWDSSRYREACERDAESWLQWFCGTPRLFFPGAAAAVRESLAAAGFAHLVPLVDAAIGRGRPVRRSGAWARRPPA